MVLRRAGSGLTLSNGACRREPSRAGAQWLLRWLWGPPHRGSRPTQEAIDRPVFAGLALLPCGRRHCPGQGALRQADTSTTRGPASACDQWDCNCMGAEKALGFSRVAGYAHHGFVHGSGVDRSLRPCLQHAHQGAKCCLLLPLWSP